MKYSPPHWWIRLWVTFSIYAAGCLERHFTRGSMVQKALRSLCWMYFRRECWSKAENTSRDSWLSVERLSIV